MRQETAPWSHRPLWPLYTSNLLRGLFIKRVAIHISALWIFARMKKFVKMNYLRLLLRILRNIIPQMALDRDLRMTFYHIPCRLSSSVSYSRWCSRNNILETHEGMKKSLLLSFSVHVRHKTRHNSSRVCTNVI